MNDEKEFSQEPKTIWGFLFRAIHYSTGRQPARKISSSSSSLKRCNDQKVKRGLAWDKGLQRAFPCNQSSWDLKAITFPFECCLPVAFLHTCEHKDFWLQIHVLGWLDDLVSVQVSHYTTISFLISFQTLGTKMYPEVASTPLTGGTC